MKGLVTYFPNALASFLPLCPSSHRTWITQKNVSHDCHVNKDDSGNSYSKISSVNGCCVRELESNLQQATSPERANLIN